ncbi:MAG: RHS repeat-associated core domain-containing protein, partial [bacterium]
ERDALGRIAVIDPLQRRTEYAFNNRGLLAKVTLPVAGAADYEYDALGLISQITDLNGSAWTFDYTSMGRPQTQTDPLGNTSTFAYDNLGRMNQTVYPNGDQMTITYDEIGNVVRRQYAGGPDLQYSFDEFNQIVSANGMELTRDAEGRIVQCRNGETDFGATYDLGGRLTYVSYNGEEMSVEYEYDSVTGYLNRVSDSLTGTELTFDYDADGRLITIQRPNQVQTIYTWDDAGRLIGIKEGTFIDLQYVLNPAGQVAQLYSITPIADPLSLFAPGSESLAYDAATQVNSPGYQYDANGRLTVSPRHQFSWDAASRITGVDGVSLSYNGMGDLISRTQSGTTIHYFYNYAIGLSPIVAEKRRGEQAFSRYYVWTPGGSLLYSVDLQENNAVTFYHFDRTGSTLALTGASGAVTDAYAYTPYGRLLAHEGGSDQPFTFVGRWGVRMEDGDLYDMRHRFYNAATARFLSRESNWPRTNDPRLLNPYQYALNDPVNIVDFTGLEPTLIADGHGGWKGTVSGHHYHSYLTGLSQEVDFVNNMSDPLEDFLETKLAEAAQDPNLAPEEWGNITNKFADDWKRLNPVDESQLSLEGLLKWRMLGSGSGDPDQLYKEAVKDWKSWHPVDESQLSLEELMKWRMVGGGNLVDDVYNGVARDWKRWHPEDESKMTLDEFIKWRYFGSESEMSKSSLRELIQQWQQMHMGERVSVDKWLARYGLLH